MIAIITSNLLVSGDTLAINSGSCCHYVQLYRYFVSQSSEFYRQNTLCCFSTSDYYYYYYYYCLFLYRTSPETFGYTRVS